ncbi:polyadenylate-binding protein-interacting protein 2B isoform X1 [Lates japonicus]|uniref:Polyadenylate-binding protein-interacting protein 2B isoform X1 n=1 Tax=Lates japonicus TaxID=270547 RepID=A0AAD3NEH7_LATJO|nr:polyadenylate-binding protein-interacting protein 2B isoform X1 [Lates japonicus]
MSGPEVAKTPGGGAPGKEGKEPVANGHAGEGSDANPFAEYMWMENEEEYNRQVEEELLGRVLAVKCWREDRLCSSLRVTSTTRGWGSCSSSSTACPSAITTATWRKWRKACESKRSSFGEEILGVPLTPMEPPRAHKHTYTPVLRYSQRLWRP